MALPVSGAAAHYTAKTGVTVTTGEVTQWNDQSGNGYNLTVPAGETGPGVGEQLNGVDTLDFNENKLTHDTNPSWRGTSNEAVVYAVVKIPAESALTSSFRRVWGASNADFRADFGAINDSDANNLRSQIIAQTTLSFDIPKPDQWVIISLQYTRTDTGAGIYVDTELITNTIDAGLSTSTGVALGDGANPTEFLIAEWALYVDTNHSASERGQIESYLSSEWNIAITNLKTIITDIETGTPKQNVVVKFFEMDAFAADGMDETTAFQNVTFLPGVFVTDANGEVEFTGTIDDTKVQGAIALDNEYDAQWKFTGWVNLGTDNIDKTAPA